MRGFEGQVALGGGYNLHLMPLAPQNLQPQMIPDSQLPPIISPPLDPLLPHISPDLSCSIKTSNLKRQTEDGSGGDSEWMTRHYAVSPGRRDLAV